MSDVYTKTRAYIEKKTLKNTILSSTEVKITETIRTTVCEEATDLDSCPFVLGTNTFLFLRLFFSWYTLHIYSQNLKFIFPFLEFI